MQLRRQLENIKGITYKSDGKIMHNPDRGPVDLDAIPDIPWHLVDIEKKLSLTLDKSLSIQTGRGCPFSCTYCSHKKTSIKKYRMFSADYVLNNIEPIVKKYNIKKINFFEPLFVNNQGRLKQICQGIIGRKLNISWGASARVDTFSKLPEDLLRLLKDSGCKELTFGFESGSQKVLDRIEKRINIQQSLKSIFLCKMYSIAPVSCFMAAFPFETLADTTKTLGLIAKLRKDIPEAIIHLQSYTAYPGSVLYEECILAYGLQRIGTLEAWSKILKWKDNRPWVKGWKKYLYKILRGSVYASSSRYLKARNDLRFKISLHFLTVLFYNMVYFLFIINYFFQYKGEKEK